jgi:Spy/CpxP family protein refolding chaperone
MTMERRISRWVGGAAVVAVVMAAPLSLALAQGPNRAMRGQGKGDGRGAALARALELTEEQQASWKEIHQKHQAEMKAQREQGRILQQELRKAAEAANPDPATVGKAFLSVKRHQEKAKAAREALRLELEATLTPEQKTKFEAIQALRPGPGGRGNRGGRGGPGGPGGPEEGMGAHGIEG